ncbi:MAG: site-specific integrase [Eubacteriales bacterium]|nr:site-specific integrase [Eubacteriales bacterium]
MARPKIDYSDNRWHNGIRKTEKGKWQCRIYYIDPLTGKQREAIRTCRTQKECGRLREKEKEMLENGLKIAPKNMTIRELVDDYIEHFQGAPSTKQSYISCAKYIDQIIGNLQISKFNENTMQLFIEKLVKKPRQRQVEGAEIKMISGKTVRNTVALLQGAYRRATRFKWIAYNPTLECELPKKEKPEIQVLSKDECKQFIQKINGEEYELIYLVDLFTGMREAEILGLTWDKVNFKQGTIKIYQQLKKVNGVQTLQEPKCESRRIVKPAEYVMQLLKQQEQVQKQQQELAGDLWDNGLNLVFTNGIGHPISDRTLYRHYKRIVADMNRPELRFHDLRHTYAVNSLLAGEDSKSVSANLGHKSVAFTLDVYAGFTNDMREISSVRQQKLIDDWKLFETKQ